MSNKDNRKQPEPEQEPTEQRNTAFADLLRAQGFAGTNTPDTPLPAAPTVKPNEIETMLTRSGKIVLRREKKGRGGKTVTLLSGLDLRPAEFELLAKALRKGLGCGSIVEEKTIVLQGDIQQRAESWLRAHGATKIVLGN